MFTPYPKINEQLPPDAKLSGPWTASEKIHGANLAIIVSKDGEEINAARRKTPLLPEEYGYFFGLATIWPRLHLAAASLYQEINQDFILYGELCGGIYPDLETDSRVSPVQGGVYYSPGLEYLPFDLYLPDDDLWLADSTLRDLVARHELLSPPLLQRGSYQQLMRLPVKFQTQLPKILGLPHIEGNYAEGFVLKPDQDLHTAERNPLKVKRNNFKETLPPKKREMISDHNSFLIYEATRRLTQARAWSARSKTGPNHNLIANEIIEDIVMELSSAYGSLNDQECALLIDFLQEPAQQLAQKV